MDFGLSEFHLGATYDAITGGGSGVTAKAMCWLRL